MSKKSIFLIIVVILIMVVFVLFNEKKIVNVSLKWKHQAQFAGMYVAKEKGYYSRKGLEVNLLEFDSNKNQIENLKNGNLDFILLSPEEFINYIDEGYDLMAVAAFYQTSPLAIVSLKDKGIKTPADFLGKKLGNKGGGVEEELIYKIILDRFGINENQIETKKLSFEKTELNNLLDNDVDAIGLYRTDQLYFFEKEGIEFNLIKPEQFGVNVSNDVLVTTREIFEKNPELIKNFIVATINGWEYAINNPEKAVDLTLEYVVFEPYKDRDYEKYILENSIPLIRPKNSEVIGYIDNLKFRNLYDVMKRAGFIEKNFEISNYYTNRFLQ